jgi:hypothetical protein
MANSGLGSYVMSLEGPQLSRFDEIRAQLNATPLGAFTMPFAQYRPLVLIGGLILGAWLAGSKTGQGWLRKR